jgi:hypothetical protein
MRIFFQVAGTSDLYRTYSRNSGHCLELQDIGHLKTTVLHRVIWGRGQNYEIPYGTPKFWRTMDRMENNRIFEQGEFTKFQSTAMSSDKKINRENIFLSRGNYHTSCHNLGHWPKLQDIMSLVTLSRNLGHCPKLRDIVPLITLSRNLGHCPEVRNFGEIKLGFSTWGTSPGSKILFERHIECQELVVLYSSLWSWEIPQLTKY